MALSESEELELLELEKSRAAAQQPAQQDQSLPVGQIASDAFKAATTGPMDATKKFFQTDPATMQRVGGPLLPIAGGIVGGPFWAAGGELLRQAGGTALSPDTVPKTPLGRFASTVTAGVAQDPKILNAIPGVPQVGEMVSNLASRAAGRAGSGAVRGLEAASGVPAKDIKQLFNKPATLFNMGSRKAAGQAIGDAKIAAGVNPGITDAPISFTPENIAKALHGDSMGEEAINRVAQANLSGARPEVEDLGDGLKYIGKKIQAGMSKGEDVSELINIQNHLNSTLEKVASNVQQARQEFAPIAQRDKFWKLSPTNKNGTVSKANLFYLNALTKGLTAPLRAPITTGLLTAAAGGAAKGLNVVGENPAIRQALLQLLQRIQQNPNAGQTSQ